MWGLGCYTYHSQKHLTCSIIHDLYQNRKASKWIIFRDFNLILNSYEKLGGNGLDYHLIDMFNNTLKDCDLTDLGYNGNQFTWANNQIDNDHIKERLDRFCANTNWINCFPRYCNTHPLKYSSDHNPILLEFHTSNKNSKTYGYKKIQRFEQLWAQDQESIQIVENAWKFTNGDSTRKLHHTLDHLTNWGKSTFGDIPKKVRDLQSSLEVLKNDIPSQANMTKVKEIEESLDNLLKQEELWWS